MDQPGPSNRPPTGTLPSTDVSLSQRLSGMKAADNIAEWVLQAVLFRARLVQYYEVFISQGGDDIDQIMQCDEREFLEIMSLVGMASKPLHVRRLQRTLMEFSRDRITFLQEAISQIGPPPLGPHFSSSPTPEQLAEIFRLVGGQSTLQQQTSAFRPVPRVPVSSPSIEIIGTRSPIRTDSRRQPTTTKPTVLSAGSSSTELPQLWPSTSTRTTPVEFLSLVSATTSTSSIQPLQLIAPTSSISPSTPSVGAHSSGTTILSDDEISRLRTFSVEVLSTEHLVEARTSRRKPNRELVEAMALPEKHPQRPNLIRHLALIYGRPGGRRPHKTLTSHETAVNEAAAQICLQQPAYLTRRDELFSLARRVVRLAGIARTIRPEESEHSTTISPRSLSTPPPTKRTKFGSEEKSPPSSPPTTSQQ
ncbi:hypothetical protein M3Y94_01143800 [Aphelenchoides besseyi]|nr:hypothetical protein M3Y94_01143800 [Aphelenchoides besseyi]KAI6227890.1 hypothetical protein M3Y95_00564500 [Aphelenchoides besseyi]